MTRAYVQRAEQSAASATLTSMGRVGHYIFRRVPAWNGFAVDNALAMLD